MWDFGWVPPKKGHRNPNDLQYGPTEYYVDFMKKEQRNKSIGATRSVRVIKTVNWWLVTVTDSQICQRGNDNAND